MDDEDICVLLMSCFYYSLALYFILPDRGWTREINTVEERDNFGFFKKTFKVVKESDEEMFRKMTRMGVNDFDVLLSLLKERLMKYSNRKSIDPECRLAITLMYLSQGCLRQVLAWAFRVGVSTVHNIIYETCESIWEELRGEFLSVPNESDFESIADSFYKICGMPNCVGAIDGKHINIMCPPNAGSEYYNYKGHHSIVLLACCDANYCFTFVDIGAFGSQSDGGIFAKSEFGKKILNETMLLPKEKALPESDIIFPFYFVADSAFPLRKHCMRPYPGHVLPADKAKFNYKLSSARRFIENTFGIMCARWRILLNTLNCRPDNADKIVKAVVVLHNFLKLRDVSYSPPGYTDHYVDGNLVKGQWRKEAQPLPRLEPGGARFNARRQWFAARDKLKEYLYKKNN